MFYPIKKHLYFSKRRLSVGQVSVCPSVVGGNIICRYIKSNQMIDLKFKIFMGGGGGGEGVVHVWNERLLNCYAKFPVNERFLHFLETSTCNTTSIHFEFIQRKSTSTPRVHLVWQDLDNIPDVNNLLCLYLWRNCQPLTEKHNASLHLVKPLYIYILN